MTRWIKNLFAPQTRPVTRPARLGVEHLDRRDMPSITWVPDSAPISLTGHIEVTGDSTNDLVYVSRKMNNVFDPYDDQIQVTRYYGGAGPDGLSLLTETQAFNVYLNASSFHIPRISSVEATLGNGYNSFTNSTSVDSDVTGGSQEDVFSGGSGDDRLDGRGGDDTLTGNGGDDILIGGSGDDTISGGAGSDLLNGGTGSNTYNSGASDSRRVIYLNFDGATMTHSQLQAWAGSDWDADGVDADHDGITVQPFMPLSFFTREAVIQNVMELVHEDFRAMDVDVQRSTGLAVTGKKATTVFVGQAVIDGYGSGLRGIACAVDGANNNQTDVAFVVKLAGANDAERAQFTANTLAHEVGHTFGLSHVNPTGLNELMRDGSYATDTQNAQNNYAFLDQSFGGQNSYRKLFTNLGLNAAAAPPGPVGVPVV